MIADAEKWNAQRIRKEKQDVNSALEEVLDQYKQKAASFGLEIEKVGLRDLRIHDLRRTLGSWMAGTGASSVIIGRQLNHKSPSATAIYSRLQQDPVTAARNKAVSAMFDAAGVTPVAQVVSFKESK